MYTYLLPAFLCINFHSHIIKGESLLNASFMGLFRKVLSTLCIHKLLSSNHPLSAFWELTFHRPLSNQVTRINCNSHLKLSKIFTIVILLSAIMIALPCLAVYLFTAVAADLPLWSLSLKSVSPFYLGLALTLQTQLLIVLTSSTAYSYLLTCECLQSFLFPKTKIL